MSIKGPVSRIKGPHVNIEDLFVEKRLYSNNNVYFLENFRAFSHKRNLFQEPRLVLNCSLAGQLNQLLKTHLIQELNKMRSMLKTSLKNVLIKNYEPTDVIQSFLLCFSI